MSEKTFNNVKITSSFDVPETGGNLVSGETIGKHFGKISKHIGDTDIHHTHSNKATLDKLSETDGGKVTYDGTEIVTVSGATMTGSLVAQANADYTVAQVRNATMSNANPTGGSNGQVHYKYS